MAPSVARNSAATLLAAALGLGAAGPARDYPVKPVPFTDVHFTDTFWLPRIELNRAVTIPFAFEKAEESKRVYHFERAAAALRGETLTDKSPPGYPFDDTDVYKVIEGAAYTLSVKPDPRLEAYLRTLIQKIAAAQEPDGYLYTTRTIDPQNPHPWAGKKRWELEEDDSHELYNLGHLYEAAFAHYQATGDKALIDISLKSAELLDKTFGPGKQSIWPGHQVTEMGLVKLYRVTGDARYLNLARFLLDARGTDGSTHARPYNQSHKAVVDQDEAVGHAVRATYMYSGMADVAALTGEPAYIKAMDRIWDDVVGQKLYITGGIGATSRGEAFGKDYELPNMTAYNETCAAIGSDYWNHRMFLLHADARYLDVMERTLYNGTLSGVSLDGKSFFYPNPLESSGQHQRSPWFGVACCPGNITRFMASLPGYVYAQQQGRLYVNLFVPSNAEVKLDGGPKVKVVQETRYPWDGAVKVVLTPETSARFTLHLRVPGWARNEPVPSTLYQFLEASSEAATLKVNGATAPLALEKGFARIDRTWAKGDQVELVLPMPVRRIVAHPAVEADAGRVALQRGPIVFLAEGPDNPNGRVRNLVLADGAPLTSEYRADLLGGVQVVKARVAALSYDAKGAVERREQDLVAIPYYSWSNRGPSEMAVWLARTDGATRVQPYPTVASRAKASSSDSGREVSGTRALTRTVNDQDEPRTSNDTRTGFFHWWPKKGTTEWLQYDFAEPATVSSVLVYWYDDTGTGQVRPPASWRVLYKDGETWKPVEAAGTARYGTEIDRFNRIAFRPVETDGLRLEVVLQPQFSAGVQEWKVE
jgi:DUF1680 family protein